MKTPNPFAANLDSWSYKIWEEGYASKDPNSSPYEKGSFPDETFRHAAVSAISDELKNLNQGTFFAGGKL